MAQKFNRYQWQKENLVRIEGWIDKKEYQVDVAEIKDKFGAAEFIRQSINLYKKDPGLFKIPSK